MAKEQASFFTVIVTGQVEFAEVRPTRDAPPRPHPSAPVAAIFKMSPREERRAPPSTTRFPTLTPPVSLFPLVVADSRV